MRYLPSICAFLACMVIAGSWREAGAQGSDSTPPPRLSRGAALVVGVLLTESIAFGSAELASRSKTGSLVIGSIQGISGLSVLSVAAFNDRETGWPEFMVPYGVGLVGLAYYNFRNANSPQRKHRFWTNVIGENAAVLTGVLSAELFGAGKRDSANMRLSPARFGVSLHF